MHTYQPVLPGMSGAAANALRSSRPAQPGGRVYRIRIAKPRAIGLRIAEPVAVAGDVTTPTTKAQVTDLRLRCSDGGGVGFEPTTFGS